MKFRFSTIIPLAGSVIALALGIVLLSSSGTVGNSADNGTYNSWAQLNTSKAGQNTIQLSQANIGNKNGSGGGDSSLTDILEGLLDGLIRNLTNVINDQFQDLQGQLISNITRALGLKNVYIFFLSGMCEGDYVDDNNPSSAITLSKCYHYEDRSQGLRRISDSIPSSFVVGTTNVSVPLVRVLSDSLDSVVSLAMKGATIMFAILVIATVCSGVVMLGSLVFFVTLQRRVATIVYIAFASLASFAFGLFAVAGTAIVYSGANVVNAPGEGIGVRLKSGDRFVTLGWVAFVFATLVVVPSWYAVWFVEFRQHAYKKRARTPEQIGNYRGILREVRADRRVQPLQREDAAVSSKEEAVAMNSLPKPPQKGPMI